MHGDDVDRKRAGSADQAGVWPARFPRGLLRRRPAPAADGSLGGLVEVPGAGAQPDGHLAGERCSLLTEGYPDRRTREDARENLLHLRAGEHPFQQIASHLALERFHEHVFKGRTCQDLLEDPLCPLILEGRNDRRLEIGGREYLTRDTLDKVVPNEQIRDRLRQLAAHDAVDHPA